MRVRFSSDARMDRREAEVYYRRVSIVVLRTFRRELMAALQYIVDFPEGAPLLSGDFRARVLRGFPYSVIYGFAGEQIFVVAVANQYRAPEHLRQRLR